MKEKRIMTEKKPKYEKPKARSLGAISTAEGACAGGAGASGTTCTFGDTTTICAGGATASQTRPFENCNGGGMAGNCTDGGNAGG
jgi:hypothetical protein